MHEQKCKEVTVGYTTKDECDEWPVERCTVEKKLVKKVTPETGCHKEPVELCAPKGCGFTNVKMNKTFDCFYIPITFRDRLSVMRGSRQ